MAAASPTTGSDARFRDFTLAFWVVTAISALATLWNRRFTPDDSAVLSGRATAAIEPRKP